MTFIGTFDFGGLSVPGAIGRVASIQIRADGEMVFLVAVYASQEMIASERPFSSISTACQYAASGGDVFAQAVAHALTLPEFSGWSVAAQ